MSANSSRRGSGCSTASYSSDELSLEDLTAELADAMLGNALDENDLIDALQDVRTWWSEKIDWYPGQRRYSRRELAFDSAVNVFGVLVGAVLLTALVLLSPPDLLNPICVYAISLEMMLSVWRCAISMERVLTQCLSDAG